MKSISLVLLFPFFLSCNGQENRNHLKNSPTITLLKNAPYNSTDEGDGTKSNYDNLPSELINTAKKILEQRKFRFPDDAAFNRKVSEVFSLNPAEYSNPVIALRPSMFPEIAVKENKFVFIQDADANEPDFINPDLLYHFNSYIFYNNPASYAWLQKNETYLLYDLVVHYGYNKDKKLVETVFRKFDFNSISDMEALLFTSSNVGKVLKKQIFDDIETIIYKGKVTQLSYAKEGNGYLKLDEIINNISSSPKEYNEPEKTISYLFDRELRVGIQGDIESYLNNNTQYRSNLEKNNFYDLPALKEYVKYIYSKENNKIFIIHDTDGYTNLRKDKNSSSPVLQKISSGEHVEAEDQSGDWWLVISKEGKKGYVHKSRIKPQ